MTRKKVSIIIAIGIKNMKMPDLTRKEFPIQYKPKRNQPKLKEHPRINICDKFFNLKIKKIEKEKQIIVG